MGARRAVFLDRDGTINFDPGYINHPDKLSLIPGAAEALALLKSAGFELVVVSNQSGVGRGIIEPEMIPRINARLNELLAIHLEGEAARIDRFELCFHRPDEGCECRKPKPKLLLDAAARDGISLTESYMVGDKLSDLRAGRAAGCRAVALVRTGEGRNDERSLEAGLADYVGDDLLDVARWITSQARR